MAAIEKGEGAEEKTIRAWLNKALTASRGPQWVCENVLIFTLLGSLDVKIVKLLIVCHGKHPQQTTQR